MPRSYPSEFRRKVLDLVNEPLITTKDVFGWVEKLWPHRTGSCTSMG